MEHLASHRHRGSGYTISHEAAGAKLIGFELSGGQTGNHSFGNLAREIHFLKGLPNNMQSRVPIIHSKSTHFICGIGVLYEASDVAVVLRSTHSSCYFSFFWKRNTALLMKLAAPCGPCAALTPHAACTHAQFGCFALETHLHPPLTHRSTPNHGRVFGPCASFKFHQGPCRLREEACHARHARCTRSLCDCCRYTAGQLGEGG